MIPLRRIVRPVQPLAPRLLVYAADLPFTPGAFELGSVRRRDLLLILLSLGAAAALQAGGISLLNDRFDRMNLLTVGSVLLVTVLGLLISFWFDAATAGSIVLVQSALFLITILLAPRRGQLARRRRAILPPAPNR